MIVSVFSDDGALIWSRDSVRLCGSTAQDYVHNGMQRRIIDALIDALTEARGQLGRPALQVVDTVSKVGIATAQVECHVPLAIVRDGNSSR
jgi:hypothetical protein